MLVYQRVEVDYRVYHVIVGWSQVSLANELGRLFRILAVFLSNNHRMGRPSSIEILGTDV